MRTATLLFIIGLVAFANTTSDIGVFTELEQNPFGSAMLDLVQINMQTNAQTEMTSEGSISKITQLLKQIQKDMQDAKKNGDNTHKSFQLKADQDIAAYKKVIKEQEDRLAQTQKQLAADRKTLATTKADLVAAQKHLVSVLAQIKAANDANVKALAVYKKTVSELTDAIKACKEAVALLAKLGTSSLLEGQQINMLQIKGGMEKVELALTHHMPARLAVYQPIVAALLDMGTNADPVLVKKITKLINELRIALENQLVQTNSNEKQRVVDYQKLVQDLTLDEKQTNLRIGRNESTIKSLNYSIKQNEGVEKGLQKTIPEQKSLLKIREGQKKTENEQYAKDNASRQSELKVIAKLINHFENNIANMSNYMKKRTGN